MNYEPLEPVAAFPYLGRMDAYNNSNWVDLYQNIWKARRWWVMVGKLVSKTGATFQARGILYKTVVQSVLLYGSESWVVTGEMIKMLEIFDHQVARRITGMAAQRNMDGEWEWTPVSEELKTAGIFPIKECK